MPPPLAADAPHSMMITFEIAPEDEAEFNHIYDNDHIPNIMQLDAVREVIRFRDAAPNERGLLVYSALYLFARENLHETPEWKALSDLGRWAPVIRPKVKSRARRAGPVMARHRK
ncbi:MAG: hypothetical protein ACT4P4_03425 [Betaproteobacteria bacterium]